MIRSYMRIYNPHQLQLVIKSFASTEAKEKWDIFTSICLERKPVITPILTELEIEFQKYLSQVELERSLKSDHEIRRETDKKQAVLLKEADAGNVDLDSIAVQTAQDFEDSCNEELAKFQTASRITDADKKNDLKSLDRKLDRHLVLLMQQKIGSQDFLLPPQSLRKEGETLRQTAERTITEFCGSNIKAQIYGNAPIGFYKYKYPKAIQETNGIVGSKVFIYFARYIKGDLDNKNNFKWLDRQEMAKEMPNDYFKNMSKFLMDEQRSTVSSFKNTKETKKSINV